MAIIIAKTVQKIVGLKVIQRIPKLDKCAQCFQQKGGLGNSCGSFGHGVVKPNMLNIIKKVNINFIGNIEIINKTQIFNLLNIFSRYPRYGMIYKDLSKVYLDLARLVLPHVFGCDNFVLMSFY